MGYRLQVRIEGVPLLARTLMSKHWREQSDHAKKWRTLVKLAVGNRRPEKPLPFSRVTIEMWRKSNEPDPENLAFSGKHLLDGLRPGGVFLRKGKAVVNIGAGVIADDRAANFEGGRAEVIWHRCKKGTKPHTIITVEEVAP